MPLTWKELIRKAKSETREITGEELTRQLPDCVLIDVRERDEFLQGHLPGALLIPRGFLELRIEAVAPERGQMICLYCGGGNRSSLSARSLQEMGYTNVFTLAGGLTQWIKDGRKLEFAREPDIDPQLS